MKIKNVSKEQLQQALDKVNEDYADNVSFKRLDCLNKNGTRFSVTLRVVSSRGKGHKVAKSRIPFIGKVRHIASACWHVHGDFFDRLLDINPKAFISSRGGDIYELSGVNGQAGRYGNWQDFNEGSQIYPCFASECCECNQVKGGC